ncbi:Transaldolase [bioreactor metagenome]|uniref:Transaldolase n=1 Tax=bioreactor metagenome TaxID=1076179 RepID=A0A645EVV2_9ZZZZ|nr:fructose-6-phosphate aldolase [Oscillospiraceae bacterium]
MEFFIDTANIEEIKKANDMGIISGVTTNPSLIAKEGRDYAQTLKEIAEIVDGPISGEVKATTTDAAGMVREGREIYKLNPERMVVKIPMTAEGLKAIKVLSGENIPTNCTLIFSVNQALLAARAGAAYVSPFLGRLDDINEYGSDLIRQIVAVFENYPDITTKVICASIRNTVHVTECALAGGDIATVPYKILMQMCNHPLTDAGIIKFQEDYRKVFGD